MGYSRASNVCIWLGEGDEEGRSEKAMDFITDIIDFAVLERYAHDKRQAEKWYALSELMRDRWFSRRCIVQEIALARDATVHCGGSVVQWSDFSDAVSLLVSNQEMIRSLFDPSEWREGDNTLGDVGSDPRDLIYSVVAIASDTSRRVWNRFASPRQPPPFELTADYKQSDVNVYKTFTKFCVLTSKSLDIICRPWAMPPRVLEEGMQFMPSWIPLLSRSEFGAPEEIYGGRKNGEVLVGPAGSPVYRASGNLGNITDAKSSDVKFLLGSEGDVLRAKGKLLGVISQVSQRTTGGVILRESLRMAGWRGIEAGGHSVPDSVWRTLVADRGRDGRLAPPWYQRACLRCLEMADRLNNGDLNVGELLQGHLRMLREYLLRVRDVTWNRRFFAIEMSLHDVKRAKPDYGLCPPETQVGDDVCVLFGCSVPVVLREMSDGHVELVGEAYLHGYMDGEGVEGLSKYDIREYKIR
ncbi:hypothetical protein CMUS01_11504 [Colletotrichum musicola]|uniref:Heterokaryon incompatibility domain-containing protein n=1 Tax=Colletotrichum musicola TaxID=2175873 RepID=A0A8H6JY62_9PEZI|nr:hypothetical protein CMUS01_11504 [Colletotrichum musicola]